MGNSVRFGEKNPAVFLIALLGFRSTPIHFHSCRFAGGRFSCLISVSIMVQAGRLIIDGMLCRDLCGSQSARRSPGSRRTASAKASTEPRSAPTFPPLGGRVTNQASKTDRCPWTTSPLPRGTPRAVYSKAYCIPRSAFPERAADPLPAGKVYDVDAVCDVPTKQKVEAVIPFRPTAA